MRVYSQHQHWSDDRWRYPGSVFEGFESVSREPSPALRRAVVTVGTLEYPFERMIRKVAAILPPEVEVTWQVGPAEVGDLPIDARRSVPSAELADAIAAADVVIAHAGTGSALAAFEAGHCPVLIPRERAHGEHVDDHQHQTASYLDRLDLAVVRSVDELTLSDLHDGGRSTGGLRRCSPGFDAGLITLGAKFDTLRRDCGSVTAERSKSTHVGPITRSASGPDPVAASAGSRGSARPTPGCGQVTRTWLRGARGPRTTSSARKMEKLPAHAG